MKRLTDEQELDLHTRLRAGDKEAAEILAQSVIHWAYKLAVKYRGNGIDPEELDSIAVCAIADALKRWDVKRGRFITCATWAIRGKLHLAIICNRTIIHYPAYIAKKVEHLKCVNLEYDYAYDFNTDYELRDYLSILNGQQRQVLKLRLQRYTCREIANKLNLSPQRISQIEQASVKLLKEYHYDTMYRGTT